MEGRSATLGGHASSEWVAVVDGEPLIATAAAAAVRRYRLTLSNSR